MIAIFMLVFTGIVRLTQGKAMGPSIVYHWGGGSLDGLRGFHSLYSVANKV